MVPWFQTCFSMLGCLLETTEVHLSQTIHVWYIYPRSSFDTLLFASNHLRLVWKNALVLMPWHIMVLMIEAHTRHPTPTASAHTLFPDQRRPPAPPGLPASRQQRCHWVLYSIKHFSIVPLAALRLCTFRFTRHMRPIKSSSLQQAVP